VAASLSRVRLRAQPRKQLVPALALALALEQRPAWVALPLAVEPESVAPERVAPEALAVSSRRRPSSPQRECCDA
jgi:hypothetical protein